jgi:hypothetical protein
MCSAGKGSRGAPTTDTTFVRQAPAGSGDVRGLLCCHNVLGGSVVS